MTTTTMRVYTPVPLEQVTIDDAFWAPRLQVNRERTLPFELQQCRETGRIDAFKLDWTPGKEPAPHIFWDSDVAKWVEATCYSLSTHPDPQLAAELDEVVNLIASAQQPDGYLNVFYTVVEPQNRWTNLRDCHELYCAGHLIEAAVAHFHTTGKRTLLDTMCRYADYIGMVFGTGEGQKRGYCGHEELELALVKLYHATGEQRYLDLSLYFVNERGQQPYYFDIEAVERGEPARAYWAGTYEYCQASKPVRELSEVQGHAVRAMYLYSAMADLAGETGDTELRAACERLWADLCLRKMYLTGGIGPSRHNEGFTTPYDLPNQTAYAETCAAIGLVLWNHRMLQWECDGKYADVMERALYNGVISGVSLDGEKYFYENPLASAGTHHRQTWFGCACCPPNLARMLAALGEYVYSQAPDGLAVHLYVQGSARTTLADGTAVAISQRTAYPWDGAVELQVVAEAPATFTLRLRIPGWCRQWSVSVNGQVVKAPVERGYACITRAWSPDDRVTLNLAMPAELIEAHPDVAHDFGRVAVQRGPLVYCLEGCDHAPSLHKLAINSDAHLTPHYEQDLLGGVMVLEGEGVLIDETPWDGTLYRPYHPLPGKPTPLRAVPYCTWDNRAPGEMAVWLRRR